MTISILINILNGAETLMDALESISKLGNEVIAVIDTRTTDATEKILAEFSAKHPELPVRIFRFTWIDSFAEARNFALEQCEGEWVFQIDHDETLDQKSIPTIKNIISKHTANAVVLSILNKKRDGIAWHPACRLFRQDCAHYVRRKHNVPVIEPNKTAFFPHITLYHSGYNLDEQGLEDKFERDEHLILLELEDDPCSVFAYRSLTRAYRSVRRHDKVIETAAKLYEMAEREGIEVSHSTRQMVAIDLIGTYTDMDDFENAEKVALKLIEEYPGNIDGHFLLATMYCVAGRHSESIPVYEKYLRLLAAQKDQPTHDQIVIESWGSEHMALHNLAFMYSTAGKHKKAARILRNALQFKPDSWGLRNAYQYELAKIADGDPLNILFVQNMTSTRNRKLAKALRSKGHRVTLAYTQENRFGDDTVFDEIIHIETDAQLYEMVNQYDIVHAMHTNGCVAMMLEEYTNAVIIRDIHDVAELFTKNPFIGPVSAISARHAAGLTFSTPHQLYQTDKLHRINMDDSMFIMNYASRDEMPKVKLPKLSDADGEFHVTYEGYVGTENHIDMREIFCELAFNLIHIHIYAAIEIEEYSKLAEQSEYIHYHGNLSFDKLIEEMTQYDAGIVPWNLEKGSVEYLGSTLANKVFDYVLAGLPVITCNSTALAWYVKEHEIGIVYDTVEDIVNNIEMLKTLDISDKAEFMEDHIDEMIGFYRMILWQQHQPFRQGISLDAVNIIAMEESNIDYINEAYFGKEFEGRNRFTKERIDRIVELADGDILDVGCSDGLIPILCARKGLTATGLDISPVHIRNASENVSKEQEEVREKIRFIRADAEQTGVKDSIYDTVIMGQLLEHVIDPDKVMEESLRILKLGGRIIATVPNGFLYDPKHLRYFDEKSFRSTLERHCSVKSIEHIGSRMLAICEHDKTTGVD